MQNTGNDHKRLNENGSTLFGKLVPGTQETNFDERTNCNQHIIDVSGLMQPYAYLVLCIILNCARSNFTLSQNFARGASEIYFSTDVIHNLDTAEFAPILGRDSI